MGKSKKEISELESIHGVYQGFFISLWNIVREKAVPFAAIHRLGTEGGRATLGKIVDLASEDWQAEQPNMSEPFQGTLPENHYCDYVSYSPMPCHAELENEKEFGRGNVSVIFDRHFFTPHSSCARINRTPGWKIYYIHDVGRDWESEEQIAWGLKQRSAIAPNGYRPATHDEEYEFTKAHPELLDYVAPGDSARNHGSSPYIALVWARDGRRVLGNSFFYGLFSSRIRILFVVR